MTFKRARLTVLVGIIAIISMLILAKCMPTEVSADPVGPPTIETHLTNINANMDTIKLMGKILLAALGIIGSLVVYIFMSLKERVVKVEEQADHIEETFLSVES